MPMTFDKSARRVSEAASLVPGGVNSNFRHGISPTPLVFDGAPYENSINGCYAPVEGLLCMRSAIRSAIMMTGRLRFARGAVGMMEASTIRRPVTP